MMKHSTSLLCTVLCCLAAIDMACADSTVTNDDFTQKVDNNSWKTFGGACLTAGDGSPSSIPACVGLKYYNKQIQVGGDQGYFGQSTAPASGDVQTPDPAGKGALRFTNGYTAGKSGFQYGFNQAGSIISAGTPFPTGAGLQVIFKTVTYRGNSGGSGGDGADGMSFFLMDGALSPYDSGAFGGSLGYSCANNNNDGTTRADGSVRGFDGLVGGYMGLGIDEYGNFLNPGDNTVTGPGFNPGRIGLRGRGNISWGWLNANYPSLYPTALQYIVDASYGTKARAAVRDTCRTGYLWDYSNILAGPKKTTTSIPDYDIIPGANVLLASLLPGKQIAAESAATRSAATPITYNLKITQDGLLSLYISYGGGSYLPVITKQAIQNGALPNSFRFGFAGSTGGSNNVHEILCFQATPADQAGTSVGVNAKQATKIASGTQAYLAYYYPNNSTGRLTASDLLYDPATQTLSISAQANWDASCNLTGVATGDTCPTTQAAGATAAQAPAYSGAAGSSPATSGRNMITYDSVSKKGIAFEWSALSNAQKATIDAGDATQTATRLNYLRGDTSNEVNSAGVGLYRGRDAILGDIIDSSPTWVGPPSSPYSAAWKDLLNGSSMAENSGTQNYTQYLTAAQTRQNVVYTGSNDGFLHAFRAGSYDANGNYVDSAATPNDGTEVLAYMPGAVLQTIHNGIDPTVDFANTQYSHQFFVDATPAADELFYANQWHTWVAGGLGPGGSAIYALDVTDPSIFDEKNAKSIVVGEWTAANITCKNVSNCGNSMGYTYGVPVIRRLHDGLWALIFGNGYGSVNGDAGVFVMLIDKSDPNGKIKDTYYFSTGTSTNNGIAYVAPADLDGDHVTDYLYAGDLAGNVWRFDLTSSSESSWGSTFKLFSTGGQPITTKLLVAITPQAVGLPRVMVDMGTGRKYPQTTLAPASYSTGSNYLYGVWDSNMTAWNGLGSIQLSSVTGTAPTLSASDLVAQTLTINADKTLDVTNAIVCWKGSTTCSGGAGANVQYGFKVALPTANEQVVFSPLLYQNAFIVNTTIPAINTPTSCEVSHDTGNTIAISVSSGGALGGFFKNTTDTYAAGSQTNATGTPFIALAAGQASMLTQSLGDGASNQVATCPAGALYCTSQIKITGPAGKRLTWIERR